MQPEAVDRHHHPSHRPNSITQTHTHSLSLPIHLSPTISRSSHHTNSNDHHHHDVDICFEGGCGQGILRDKSEYGRIHPNDHNHGFRLPSPELQTLSLTTRIRIRVRIRWRILIYWAGAISVMINGRRRGSRSKDPTRLPDQLDPG